MRFVRRIQFERRVFFVLIVVTAAILGWADSARAQWCSLTQVLEPGGTSNDFFGYSAAMSGDTAVIGSYRGGTNGAGTVTVYRHIGNNWQFEAKLTASDGAFGDWFGASVAIDGDTVVVGAQEDTLASIATAGSAYVFVRSGTTWTQQQKLTADFPANGDNFGISVAVSGDTAIVGADERNFFPSTDQGSAFVFVRAGTVWTLQDELTASDAAMGDHLGISVGIIGDTVFVGAQVNDVNGNENQGSVYQFTRSGAVWIEQSQILAPDGLPMDNFGWAMAVSGDSLIVSSIGDDIRASNEQGSAYVFVNNAGSWTFQQKLVASDGSFEDIFGMSVDIDGDRAIIGAHRDDLDGAPECGSAYVFTRSGTAWTEQTKFNAPDAGNNDRFGTAVAIASSSAVIGSPQDNVGSVSDQGSAYFASGSCTADIIGCNGQIDVDDLLTVINAWGACGDPNDCPADIAPAGGDDVVDVDDLLAVINAWGSCQ
jgi:hypothetical protein